MNRSPDCQAYQERDGSHYCGRCHLRWDSDSIDPPDCLTEEQRVRLASKRIADSGFTTDDMKKGLERVGRAASGKVSQDEQDEINQRNMAKMRECFKNDS